MKLTKLTWIVSLSVLFFLPACRDEHDHDHDHDHDKMHHDEVNIDSVREIIVAMDQSYSKAIMAKDVDKAASNYANDAQSFADGAPTRVGIDAIKAGIKEEIDADTSGGSIALEPIDVWASGKIAIETGKITSKDKAGNVTYSGKYMALYELRDGKYVVIRDIWNADKGE